MPLIFTGNGPCFEVDVEDFYFLLNYTWSINNRGYPYSSSKGKTLLAHRLIASRMGLSLDQEIDHEDRSPLNCKRCNLRIATHSQNQTNTTKYKGTTSRFKGVSWHQRMMCYRARIKVAEKEIFLGNFQSEAQAAIAYNIAAKTYFGEFAVLNQIEDNHNA